MIPILRPLNIRTASMRLLKIMISLGILFLATGACSLFTAAVQDDRMPQHEEGTKLDLFAASKNELIDEIRRNRKIIQTQKKEKEFLLTENLRLSNELRATEVRTLERKPEPPVQNQQAILDIPAVSKKAKLTAFDFHSQGVTAFSKGDFDEALANFYKSVAINPKFYEAFTNIGVVYMTVGKLEKAIQNFETALKIKPDFQFAQNYMKQAADSIQKEEEKKRAPVQESDHPTLPEPPKAIALDPLPAIETTKEPSAEKNPAPSRKEGTLDKLKDTLKNLPKDLPGGK